MKLLRYGPPGNERPGLLDAKGDIRDLSRHIADVDADALSPQRLASLAALDPATLPVVPRPQRLGVPVAGTRQFIAVGLNYADHAAEIGQVPPAEPILFTKAISCLQGPDDAVPRPRGATRMDWEAELAIVIGKQASYVDKAGALSHVAGYTICHDVSERAFQFDRGGTWDKGKGCAGFGPVGPWLVTPDEAGDIQDLDVWLEVNGQRQQDGNTGSMIFDCATLVSYISQFMVLLPGDIIATGTPAGVGMSKSPPRWLAEGDVVELGIENLGRQRHRIVAWDRQ